MGPTLPLSHCVPWALSRGVKRPGRVADSIAGLHNNDQWLVVVRGVIDINYENSTKGISALQGKYTDFNRGGIYSYHLALN